MTDLLQGNGASGNRPAPVFALSYSCARQKASGKDTRDTKDAKDIKEGRRAPTPGSNIPRVCSYKGRMLLPILVAAGGLAMILGKDNVK